MGQAAQVLRGGFTLHVELLRRQAHGSHHRDIQRAVVRHVGLDDRIHDGGFMRVDGDIHALVADDLHDRVADALDERAVRATRIAAVDVADILIRQRHVGGIVDVGERIRPGIQRVRPAVAVLELHSAPVGIQLVVARVSVAEHAGRGGAAVGLRNDNHAALLHVDVLQQRVSGKARRRLIRMRTADVKHRAALHAGIEEEHRRIAVGAFQIGQPLAEHVGFRQRVGGDDGFLGMSVVVKIHAGQRCKHQSSGKRDELFEEAFIHFHFTSPLT